MEAMITAADDVCAGPAYQLRGANGIADSLEASGDLIERSK